MNKAVKYLSKFSSVQRKNTLRFLESPFYNTSDEVYSMALAISNLLDNNNDEKHITKEMIIAEAKLENDRFHALQHQLIALLEQFLVVSQIPLKGPDYIMQLYTIAKQLQLDHLADKTFGLLEKDIEDPKGNRNEEYLYHLFRFKLGQISGYEAKTARRHQSALGEAEAALDEYYLLLKLNLASESINRKEIVNKDGDLSHVSAAVLSKQVLASPKSWNSPLVRPHAIIYEILSTGNENNLQELLTFLSMDEIHKQERRVVFEYLFNYWIQKPDLPYFEYLKNQFQLINIAEKKGLLTTGQGQINHQRFKVIVDIGLALGEVDWVYNFLTSNTKSLPSAFRHHTSHLCWAQYWFHLKDINQAHEHLIDLTMGDVERDVYLSIAIRKMLLYIYIAQGNNTAGKRLIASLEKYIDRAKILTGERKSVARKLIGYSSKWFELDGKMQQTARATLMKQAQADDNFKDKNWFMAIAYNTAANQSMKKKIDVHFVPVLVKVQKPPYL